MEQTEIKEKKAGRIIILVAFVVIICLSRPIWLVVDNFVDSTNYEKRQLATRPELTLEGYKTFSSEYMAYFNDNLQFRNMLIEMNSMIDYCCFKRSANDRVVVGKDNWLFYAREDDGDPIGCYTGEVIYSEEELAQIAENCINQRDFLAEQGKEFVIFIAPNKERMYSEYMPDAYGEPAEEYGALQIYSYLKDNTDLRVVYPYDELMEAKERLDENIYAKTDTHWNDIGAYIGTCALMKELCIEMPDVYSDDITIIEGDSLSGDLAEMLNLGERLKFIDNEYTVEGYDSHDVQEIEWDVYGMIRFCSTGADVDDRKIFFVRDSFAEKMAKYVGSEFVESNFRHINSYTYDDYVEYNPDIFVLEVVERYAGKLKTFSVNNDY